MLALALADVGVPGDTLRMLTVKARGLRTAKSNVDESTLAGEKIGAALDEAAAILEDAAADAQSPPMHEDA